MSNYYATCFYRINFVVIASYIELPWYYRDHLIGSTADEPEEPAKTVLVIMVASLMAPSIIEI